MKRFLIFMGSVGAISLGVGLFPSRSFIASFLIFFSVYGLWIALGFKYFVEDLMDICNANINDELKGLKEERSLYSFLYNHYYSQEKRFRTGITVDQFKLLFKEFLPGSEKLSGRVLSKIDYWLSQDNSNCSYICVHNYGADLPVSRLWVRVNKGKVCSIRFERGGLGL